MDLSRREFLKATGLIGGIGLALASLGLRHAQKSRQQPKIQAQGGT